MSDLLDNVRSNLAVLDLEPGVSWQQVKDRYRFLAKVWHPDRFGADLRARSRAEKQFKTVNEAYQWLLQHRSTVDSLAESPQTERADRESAEQEPAPQPREPRPRPKSARQREEDPGASNVERVLWGVIATFTLVACVIFIASWLPGWLDRRETESSPELSLGSPPASTSAPQAGDESTRRAPTTSSRGGEGSSQARSSGPVMDFATFARANQPAERGSERAVTDVPAPGVEDDSGGENDLIRGAWKPKNPDPGASRQGTAGSSNSRTDLEHWSGGVDGAPPPDLPRVSIRLYEDVVVGQPMGKAVYWHEAGACSYALQLREQIGDWMRTEQVREASECDPLGEIWFLVDETDLTALWHRLDGSQWFSSRLSLD